MDVDRLERIVGLGSPLLSTVLLFRQERLPVLIMKRTSAGGIVDQEEGPRNLLDTVRMKAWTTHVGHNAVIGNTRHGVLDVLLDESTESGVLKLGSLGTRISRTVFPKLDDFITEDKRPIAKTCAGYRMEGGRGGIRRGEGGQLYILYIAFLLPRRTSRVEVRVG